MVTIAGMGTARLKIHLFTYSTKLRGSVVHTLELAEALYHLGQDVQIYALSKEGQGFDYPVSCPIHLIPTGAAPAQTDALIQQRIQEFVTYLRNHPSQADIYHAQDCLSANALVQLRQQQPLGPIVRTVHHIEDYPSPYLRECQSRSIEEADLCLCVSDRWQAELQHQYQKIAAPRVINGVNLQRFSPIPDGREASLRQRWQLHGWPLYLTVGGVEPRKNSLNLLRAFAQVRQTLPQAQLIIAGGETLFDYQPYRQEFFALAEALGIEVNQALVLPGVIGTEDLPALYRLAHGFVFPSTREGWGLVLLEAIASGLPILTSNQPPFTEFLTPQQALLVDPQAPAAIAEAMVSLVQPDTAHYLVNQSQSVLSRYTWQASAKQHLGHYHRLIDPVPEIHPLTGASSP